jgi:hypothetical protein
MKKSALNNWVFDMHKLDRVKCPVCRVPYNSHDLNGMLTCQQIATDFMRDFILPLEEGKRIDRFAVGRKTWEAFLQAFPKYKYRDLTTRERIEDAS